MGNLNPLFRSGGIVVMLAGALATSAFGDVTTRVAPPSDNGYKVGESASSRQQAPGPTPVDPGPTNTTRLARIEYISGKVTWRPDSRSEWSNAKVNMPMRQGAEIWTNDHARVELRFSDGSILRAGNGVIALKSLYSDDQGEYSNVQVLSGLVTVRPRQERSIFELTTPGVSVKTSGPARVRVGVTDVVEIGVQSGRAVVEGSLGKTTMVSGEFLTSRSSDKQYAIGPLPQPDSWERWNDERDRLLTGSAHAGYYRPGYYPPSVWFSLDVPFFPEHRHFGHRRW